MANKANDHYTVHAVITIPTVVHNNFSLVQGYIYQYREGHPFAYIPYEQYFPAVREEAKVKGTVGQGQETNDGGAARQDVGAFEQDPGAPQETKNEAEGINGAGVPSRVPRRGTSRSRSACLGGGITSCLFPRRRRQSTEGTEKAEDGEDD